MAREAEGELVEAKPPFFHPLSGLAILGIDWLCFGLEWELGPVSVLAMSAAAFGATYLAVRRVQERLSGDAPRAAKTKALLGALAAGVPFAIGGTIVGGAILALSGLRTPWRRPGRRPASGTSKTD